MNKHEWTTTKHTETMKTKMNKKQTWMNETNKHEWNIGPPPVAARPQPPGFQLPSPTAPKKGTISEKTSAIPPPVAPRIVKFNFFYLFFFFHWFVFKKIRLLKCRFHQDWYE